jgi:hypothetical protein
MENSRSHDVAIPTVHAHVAPDRKTLQFYCRHCRKTHTYPVDGVVLDGTGKPVHRPAACTRENSPYRQTGVMVRVVG